MQNRESNSYPFDEYGEVTARRLHLDLLGTFRLHQGDQPVGGFEHARLQHFLAYLALHRAAPISRQQLAFLFWPDSTDQQALKNLRTLITRLRHDLPDASRFIDITAETITWLADAPFTLDVAEFKVAVKSHVPGKFIYQIGYHILPCFLSNWERLRDIPLVVFAHSAHARESGVMVNGIEKSNVKVTLASKIPPEDCDRSNLAYLDTEIIHPAN